MSFEKSQECEREAEIYSSKILKSEEKIGYVKFAGLDEPQEVKYVEVDGLAIMQGDIIIGKADEMITKTQDTSPPFTFLRELGKKWPGGVVPYLIASDLPQPERVQQAIQHWHSNTIIKLVPRTNEQNYIYFVKGDGCSSDIGMRGGQQVITLGSGCEVGSAIHEIGHALGMFHEQCAPNRDEYIEIHWENIEERFKYNFEITTWQEAVTYGPYDYSSIMHYGRYGFSKNGQPTIVPKIDVEIGQRRGLSQGDIQGINSLYGNQADNDITFPVHQLDVAADPSRPQI
ncbi:M12 family metallopeptidase [Priestia megaterium]|uniref:M12 family metallopeptidase n=1 Tax=Priestia megaterium TaxID=1404 RepID=UPI000BFD8B9D|nr:M12 family metallopeptidase [Priestia megaterium]PGT73601.1 zinc metalloprotease [Priestia megaterium]